MELKDWRKSAGGSTVFGFFDNLSVAAKLYAGTSIIFVAVLAFGLVALQSMNTLSGLTNKLYDHPHTVLVSLARARADMASVQREVRNAIIATDHARVEESLAMIAGLEKSIGENIAIAERQFLGDKAYFSALDDEMKKWGIFYHRLLALAKDGKRDEAAALVRADGSASVARVDEFIGKAEAFASNKAATFVKNAKATSESLNTTITAVMAGVLAIGAMVSFFVARSISRPMAILKDSMLQLAEGNLAVVLPGLGRRDEVGTMAKAVAAFKTKAEERAKAEVAAQIERERAANERRKQDMNKLASEFEAAVGAIVGAVSSASAELEEAATMLSGNAAATQQRASTVVAASEQASTNTQSVAAATEQMTASVNEIGRQVSDSSRIVGNAVEQARRTDERMNGLSQAANRIGDVVNLITAIAEQTNLLALNATIEAARAGESGKGFAVVAQEVKQLAAQTAKATSEIGGQISGIQTATQESVKAIREIVETINQVSEISSSIAAAVEQQGVATGEIARSIQEAARGTSEVASNITTVNRDAADTGTASGQVLASARSLSADSSKLKLAVDGFLVTVRAA